MTVATTPVAQQTMKHRSPRVVRHDHGLGDLACAFAVEVPDEKGGICVVEVLHNHVRRSYEVEFTDELLALAPQAVTATVQLVMLTIQREGH